MLSHCTFIILFITSAHRYDNEKHRLCPYRDFFFQLKGIYCCKRHIKLHNVDNKVSYSTNVDSGPSSVDSLARDKVGVGSTQFCSLLCRGRTEVFRSAEVTKTEDMEIYA